MEKNLSSWERIESVIEWANMTTNYFARYIGLPRGENLYQIKKGNHGISRKIAVMVVEKFPQINILWLLTGSGSMLAGTPSASTSKPFYNVGVEESIRLLSDITPESQMLLPLDIDCDFGIIYKGRAMAEVIPTNTVLLLKKILPEMIIPGDECVIVTKKIVLLRIVKFEEVEGGEPRLRLISANPELFGDVVVDLAEVDEAYKVKGKVLIN